MCWKMNGIRMYKIQQGHPVSENRESSPALARMWPSAYNLYMH